VEEGEPDAEETAAVQRMPRWRGDQLMNPEEFSPEQRDQLMALRRRNGTDSH
jgi:hypothetical protein